MRAEKIPEPLKFTYQDYLLLPDERRYEIIDGELYMMPSPITNHQMVLLNLAMIFTTFVRERDLGKIFIAPYDVILSKHDIVQPDLLFVSKEKSSLITEKNLQGVPDLVIEITSSPTKKRDRVLKKRLYAHFGIKEYWIVDLYKRVIEVYSLAEKGYELKGSYGEKESFNSHVLKGLIIRAEDVFKGMLT